MVKEELEDCIYGYSRLWWWRLLRCLVEGGYNVVRHYDARQACRTGHKLQFSPVKQYALEHNLPPPLCRRSFEDEACRQCMEGRFADSRCLPHVAGAGMEHAAIGHLQPACFPFPQQRAQPLINRAVIVIRKRASPLSS